jgi:hypothetical protein
MNGQLSFTKEETVFIAADEGCYSIRKIDWDRIKRLVNKTPKKEINYSIYFSILFGIAGSSGVSIVPILFADNLPSWVAPTYIIVTIVCLVLGFIFKNYESINKRNKEVDINEIKIELDEIEKLYNQNPKKPQE